MALKSIFTINVNSAAFTKFAAQFQKFQTALNRTPTFWKALNAQIAGSGGPVNKLSSQFTVGQNAILGTVRGVRQIAPALNQAATAAAAATTKWAALDRVTVHVASTIKGATLSLGKWTGLLGGAGAALGLFTGGFGFDRLAEAAASGRKSAIGQGLPFGQQRAFEANADALIDNPASFLAQTARGRFDISQSARWRAFGINTEGSAGDTAISLLQKARQFAQTTKPELYEPLKGAYGLGSLSSFDINRLGKLKQSEFDQRINQIRDNAQKNLVPDDVLKKYQDLTTQLENAANAIQSAFIIKLAKLAPVFETMSHAFESFVEKLLRDGGPFERWVNRAAGAFERLSKHLDDDKFQDSVVKFIEGLAKLAHIVVDFVKWVGDKVPAATGPQNLIPGQETNDDLRQQHEDTLARALKQRKDREEGKSSWWKQLGEVVDAMPSRQPASVRYNNPGAQYPSDQAKAFGMEGTGVIGGGHLIAKFPTPEAGAAANMALLDRSYAGMSIGEAGKKWTGGNSFGVPGYDPNTVLTHDMLHDPKFMVPLMQSIAKREAGKESPLTKEQWNTAFKSFEAGRMVDLEAKQKSAVHSVGPLEQYQIKSGGDFPVPKPPDAQEQGRPAPALPAPINIQKFAEGSSFVPRDMLAMIHKGEIIVPRKESDQIRGSGTGIAAAKAAEWGLWGAIKAAPRYAARIPGMIAGADLMTPASIMMGWHELGANVRRDAKKYMGEHGKPGFETGSTANVWGALGSGDDTPASRIADTFKALAEAQEASRIAAERRWAQGHQPQSRQPMRDERQASGYTNYALPVQVAVTVNDPTGGSVINSVNALRGIN